MSVTREMTIAGISVVALRDALKIGDSSCTARGLAFRLGLKAEEGEKLVAQLERVGYAEPA